MRQEREERSETSSHHQQITFIFRDLDSVELLRSHSVSILSLTKPIGVVWRERGGALAWKLKLKLQTKFSEATTQSRRCRPSRGQEVLHLHQTCSLGSEGV